MDLKRPIDPASAPSPPGKRPRQASPKRRTSGGGSDDDNDDQDALTPIIETFRKEAIYRQMLEYKRMHSRAAARVSELERRRTALQAGLQGVEVCWSELLEAVRGIVGVEGLPPVATKADYTFPSDEAAVPELQQAVDQRSQSTQALLVKFVSLANQGVRATQDELRERSLAERRRADTLAGSLEMLRAELEDARAEQERTAGELLRAEKKLDRLRCTSITGQQKVADGQAAPPTPVTPAAGPSSSALTPNASAGDAIAGGGAASGAPSPSTGVNGATQPQPNGATPHTSTIDPSDPQPSLASLVEATLPDPASLALAESRLVEINALRGERVRLETLVDRLRVEVDHPPQQVVEGSALCRALVVQLEGFKAQAEQARKELEKLVVEADSLRDGRSAFETHAVSEAQVEVDSLRTQLTKREQDLARLRGERDELQAKLNEKKARESVKIKHVEEAEALVKSSEERISSLKSDIARLRTKLAAGAGSESLFAFLLSETSPSAAQSSTDGAPLTVTPDYVKHLETQLRGSETRIAALTAQMAQLAGADAALLARLTDDSSARQELAVVQGRVGEYERAFGSDAKGEVGPLAERLREKQAELETMERKLKENEIATDALYSEVERLSAAWEEASAHVNKKVFGLKEMEDKLSKVLTEKAKADNKYFAAMRSKDAVEGEKKTLARNAERQMTVIEKLTASEKSLGQQLSMQEQQITLLRRQVLELQGRTDDLQRLYMETKVLFDGEVARSTDQEKVLAVRTAAADKDRAARLAAEEELAKARRETEKAEKALAKMKAAASSAAASGTATIDPELQEERDKLFSILRCSTCSLRLRSHCITKCMHTFCKECIDTRIATRQRKCPACNLGFAVSDVAQVYFQ